jgi:hypothetical protein
VVLVLAGAELVLLLTSVALVVGGLGSLVVVGLMLGGWLELVLSGDAVTV